MDEIQRTEKTAIASFGEGNYTEIWVGLKNRQLSDCSTSLPKPSRPRSAADRQILPPESVKTPPGPRRIPAGAKTVSDARTQFYPVFSSAARCSA